MFFNSEAASQAPSLFGEKRADAVTLGLFLERIREPLTNRSDTPVHRMITRNEARPNRIAKVINRGLKYIANRL